MPTRNGQKDGAGGGGGTGDITAVTVSAGGLLSGGGTSGDVNIASRFDNNLTWTGTHTYNPGTSQATPILLGMAQPSSAGQRDSHALQWRGTSFDTGGHNADWRMFVDVTGNDGSSTFVVQTRKDAASFSSKLSVSDAGLVTVAGKIAGLTQATASGEAVHAGRTLTGGTGINAIGDLTADRTISVDTSVISTKTYADSTAAAAASGKADSSVTITAGAGLSGGGNLTTNRTIDIGANPGSGITVNADDIAVDQSFSPNWTGVHTFTSASLPVAITRTDGASSAATVEVATMTRLSSGAGVAGNGVQLTFQGTNSAGDAAPCASVQGIMRVVTAGSEAGTALITARQSGAQTICGWGTSGQWYAPTLALGSITAAGVTTQTAQVTINSTFVEYKSNNASQGGHKFIGTTNTSGARSFFVILPSSNTGTTASTAVPGFDYQTYTRTWATGAGPTEQIEFKLQAPTYAAAGASTFPLASTLAITGAPIPGTNMTITQPLAFHVQSGGARFDGNIGFYGVSPAAQGTGGYTCTNNITAGGSDGVFADFAASSYATDAATIRNNQYVQGKMIKAMWDWMRAAGPLT